MRNHQLRVVLPLLVMAELATLALPRPSLAGPARCRETGVATVPGITTADLRAIQRAVVTLPAVRRSQVQMSVGAVQPPGLETKAVPAAVRKVLPQYAGYEAFRTGHDLVIIKPGSRRLAYILPLQHAHEAPTAVCR